MGGRIEDDRGQDRSIDQVDQLGGVVEIAVIALVFGQETAIELAGGGGVERGQGRVGLVNVAALVDHAWDQG